MLTDDVYFGSKAFVTCYCEESFRPKLPSVQQMKMIKAQTEAASHANLSIYKDDSCASSFGSSPSKLLNKLRDAADMAISVTTGRKLEVKKNPNASNVITGFGYSVLDLFENQYVDMESIVKSKVFVEENKSPFKSPAKKKKKDTADGGFGGLSLSEIRSEVGSPEKFDREKSKERAVNILSTIEEL